MGILCGDFRIQWALGAHGPALEISQNRPIVWYGMVWYGMVWYGMVWNTRTKNEEPLLLCHMRLTSAKT